jgi:hypothetical protein
LKPREPTISNECGLIYEKTEGRKSRETVPSNIWLITTSLIKVLLEYYELNPDTACLIACMFDAAKNVGKYQ